MISKLPYYTVLSKMNPSLVGLWLAPSLREAPLEKKVSSLSKTVDNIERGVE